MAAKRKASTTKAKTPAPTKALEPVPTKADAPRPIIPVDVEGANLNINPSAKGDIEAALGVDSQELGIGLLSRLCGAVQGDMGQDADNTVAASTALAAVAELKPNGAAEAMIASMAVASHELALRLCSVASKNGGKRLGFSQTAVNAMRTSANLLGELDKRQRGPVPQQRVEVKHVHVADGGQVAMGCVSGKGGVDE